jgi:hypothetical protein
MSEVGKGEEIKAELVEDVKTELEREVKDIAKEINQLTSDKIEEFLNDAIDIEVIKFLREKEFSGFDILITFGGPNIRFIFNRGKAEIVGNWGGAEVVEQVEIDKAEEILNYLNDISS